MTTQEDNNMIEQKKEDWMNAKWRPMMGWMYMLVCTMDFVVFPILWSIINTVHSGSVGQQWNPITLQGAGLFHMAMGAVIGVAAFGRTQEKLAGANNTNSFVSSPTPVPMTAPVVTTVSMPSPVTVPETSPVVLMSSTGKAMPPPQVDQPL